MAEFRAINLLRRVELAGAFVATMLLAACGNSGLLPPSQATGDAAGTLTAQPVAVRASPDAGRSSVDRGEGNPFVDRSSLMLASREVIAKPTLDEVMQPVGSLPEMSLGRADAPVTVIKYASMTCPFCRQFQIEAMPELKRHYIDTGKMRFILREFPIGFQSGMATIALRCVPEAKYFQAYDRLMRQQNAWVSQEVRPDPILKVVGDLGLTRDQFEACRQDQGLVQALNAVKERGRTLGIVGTPNFFVNGRLVKSTLTLNDLKAIVDPILAGGGSATAQKS